jgi:hypothetical protein
LKKGNEEDESFQQFDRNEARSVSDSIDDDDDDDDSKHFADDLEYIENNLVCE